MCNHVLTGSHISQISNKITVLNKKHESKLVVPNKWDNFGLNSCILIWGIGETPT